MLVFVSKSMSIGFACIEKKISYDKIEVADDFLVSRCMHVVIRELRRSLGEKTNIYNTHISIIVETAFYKATSTFFKSYLGARNAYRCNFCILANTV